MFDIGWSELLVIAVVALIVIGPKELPGTLRTVGQWIGKIRRMASEFQGQFQDAMREAEVADLKKTFDDATTAKDYGLDFSAIGNIKQDMEKIVGDLPASATDMTATKPADAVVSGPGNGAGPVTPEPAPPLSTPEPRIDVAPVAVTPPTERDILSVSAPAPEKQAS